MNYLLKSILILTMCTSLYSGTIDEKHEYPKLLYTLKRWNVSSVFAVTNDEQIILIDHKLRICGKKVYSYTLPKEYREAYNFIYDKVHNTIYIYTYGKIGCFTLQGKLIKEIKVDACNFFLQHDTIFVFNDEPLSMGMVVDEVYQKIDFPTPDKHTLRRGSIEQSLDMSICSFRGRNTNERAVWNGWEKDIYEFTLRNPSHLRCDTLITPFDMVLIGGFDNKYLFLDFEDKTPLPIYEYDKGTKKITAHLLHDVGERLDRYFDNGDSIEYDWGRYPTIFNEDTRTLYILVYGEKNIIVYKWKL